MRAYKSVPIAALFLAFGAGAWVVAAAFLWRAYRSGLLAKWVILGAILLRASAPVGSPRRLFKEHILAPIPKSVADIKVDRAREFFGYGYVFHFKISDEDANRIIASRPYERVHHVTYGYGDLYYDDWCSPALLVYPSGEEPAWLVRGKIRGSEGYAYEEVKDRKRYTWVLLCRRELGEAYFFAFKGDN